MADIRKQILSLRTKTSRSRYFIPDSKLRSLMTNEVVAAIISSSDIEIYKQKEVSQIASQGAIKILAILILMRQEGLITLFIERDGLQDLSLDHRLPYGLAALQQVLGDRELANEFLERQWELVAPIFSNDRAHRFLDNDTVLPFIDEEYLAKGGFGLIYKSTLTSTHQQIEPSSVPSTVYVVRKEIRQDRKDTFSAESEEKILSTLRGLMHPNIIRLICSYTYNGIHNMLFPLADGNLAEFLTQPRLPAFKDDLVFLHGTYGLSSALEALHEYFSTEFDLKLIGCHYDLRPKNVLVSGTRFLLSDFGLSRLKPVTDGSHSDFKAAVGDCTAPECYIDEASFQKNSIGRASDVWSFGCIMADIATFMDGGPAAVERFFENRLTRLYTNLGWIGHHQFHSSGKLNQGVEQQLNELQSRGSRDCRGLSSLSEHILFINPDSRPRIGATTLTLSLLVLRGITFRILDKFQELLRVSGNNMDGEISIEYSRFKSWMQAVQLDQKDSAIGEKLEWLHHASIDSEAVQAMLNELHQEVATLVELVGPQRTLQPLFVRLRMLIDRLWNAKFLSKELKAQIRSLWKSDMLDTDNTELLHQRQELLASLGIHDDLGILITIKHMVSLVQYEQEVGNSDKLIDLSDVEIGANFQAASLGRFEGGAPIFIEWITYDSRWLSGTTIRPELYRRIGAMVKILRLSKSAKFRVLNCEVYFHEPSSSRFGLVFEYPAMAFGKTLSPPVVLNELLAQWQTSKTKPTLGDRYTLAVSIISGVTEFHEVGWVHKTLSSHSILFFLDREQATSDTIVSPYITDFARSRQDTIDAFSLGTTDASALYAHPDYRMDSDRRAVNRFRLEYDYYSIGLLLLEIGLWRTLSSIWEPYKSASKGTVDLHRFKKHLVSAVVPALGAAAGSIYRDAVSCCLDTPQFEEIQDRSEKIRRFVEEVVTPISTCRA